MTEPKYRGSRAPKYRGSTACSLYKLRAKPVGFWDGAALGVNYGWPGCKFTEDHVRLCFCECFLRERFDIGLHGGPPAGEAAGVAPHKSGIESDNDLECFGYVLTLYFRVPVTKWCYIYVENHLSTI